MDSLRRPVRPFAVSFSILASILSAAAADAQSHPPDPAHSIAEKFAAADAAASAKRARQAAEAARVKAEAAKRRLETERRADEIDMLARARAEAAERALDRDGLGRLADEAEADARRSAEAAQRASREAWETAEMERLRAEQEARSAAEAAAIANAAVEAGSAASDEATVAEQPAVAVDQTPAGAGPVQAASPATVGVPTLRSAAGEASASGEMETVAAVKSEAERKAEQAEREAETMRIVDKLRAARAAKAAEAERLAAEVEQSKRAAEAVATAAAPVQAPSRETAAAGVKQETVTATPKDVAVAVASAAKPTDVVSTRATVILVLDTGAPGLGRTGNSTADPVLCLGPTCYAGQGADRPAKAMTRSHALGPGNTLGARAAACARSLACVYRDVDFSAAAGMGVQPVDLRLLRHDRRDIANGAIDGTCGVADGRLRCAKPLVSATWRAWIVPEAIAQTAGAKALSEAAASRLNASTRLSDVSSKASPAAGDLARR